MSYQSREDDEDRWLDPNGVYEVTDIPFIEDTGDKEVADFIEKYPDYVLADNAGGADITFLFARRPEKAKVKIIGLTPDAHGAALIIDNCPKTLLILGAQ